MSVPLIQNGPPLTMIAGAAITKYAACIQSAEGVVVVGSGTNAAGFIGVAQNAAATGEAVRLSRDGDVTKVLSASTTITALCWLTLSGTAGAVDIKGTTAATAYNVIGQALEVGDTAGDEVVMIQRPFYDRNIA
jgi:hypothetical protein